MWFFDSIPKLVRLWSFGAPWRCCFTSSWPVCLRARGDLVLATQGICHVWPPSVELVAQSLKGIFGRVRWTCWCFATIRSWGSVYKQSLLPFYLFLDFFFARNVASGIEKNGNNMQQQGQSRKQVTSWRGELGKLVAWIFWILVVPWQNAHGDGHGIWVKM